MSLFTWSREGRRLHSGGTSRFFIDCDALSRSDIETLATFVALGMPQIGAVESIPRGGDRLANALASYVRPGADLTLLVDDVLTTGESMEEARKERESVWGVVIFARGPYPAWVRPIFVMPGRWPK